MQQTLGTPQPSSAVVSKRLGRFTILADLARGGMSEVFVAQKDGAEDICVLKRLLGELQSHSTASQRFYREAHVASFLLHPNLVRVTDAGFEGGFFCIAADFIAGVHVEQLIVRLREDHTLPPYPVTLCMALDVLSALRYAHDALDPSGEPLGLVHRDLAPRNIMIGFDGIARVIDFGIAHGNVDRLQTGPGIVLGTLRYASPEQANGEAVDRRSDLYALSVVLYEMLTGQDVVRGFSPPEMLQQISDGVLVPLSSANPDLSPELSKVIMKGLKKAPSERWRDAASYAAALKQCPEFNQPVDRRSIGAFLSGLFPEEKQRALSFIELGRSRHTKGQHAAHAYGATLAPERLVTPPPVVHGAHQLPSTTLGDSHAITAFIHVSSTDRVFPMIPLDTDPDEPGLDEPPTLVVPNLLNLPHQTNPKAWSPSDAPDQDVSAWQASTEVVDRTEPGVLPSAAVVDPASDESIPVAVSAFAHAPAARPMTMGLVLLIGAAIAVAIWWVFG